MIYKQFYSELGKLLYAIADVDGMITEAEKRKLKELVRKELVPLDNQRDEFGTDAAYYTEFEFDIQEDEMPDTQTSFQSFMDFIEEHKSDLDENLLWATHRVAEKVAESYYGTNRKEKKLLQALDKKLETLIREKSSAVNQR